MSPVRTATRRLDSRPANGGIAIHGALIGSVVSGVIYTLWHKLPTLEHVPDVVGLPQAQGAQRIASAGLKVGTIVLAHSSTVAKGDVISSSPAAGGA